MGRAFVPTISRTGFPFTLPSVSLGVPGSTRTYGKGASSANITRTATEKSWGRDALLINFYLFGTEDALRQKRNENSRIRQYSYMYPGDV